MAPGTPFLPTTTDEKTLRSSFVRDEDERPKVAYNQFSNDIPVISLAGLDDEEGVGGDERKEICHKIVAACEDWGIFQVVDHGVDVELVSEMTRLAKEFFKLPLEEKLRFDMSGGKKGGFIVSSHLQGEAVQDWREIVTFFSYPIGARDYSRWHKLANNPLHVQLLQCQPLHFLNYCHITYFSSNWDQSLLVVFTCQPIWR